MSELALAKAVAVPKKNTLPDSYQQFYVPEVDMYLFFTEASYDTTTGSYSGVRLLHDRLMDEQHIGYLKQDQFNYVTVDLAYPDKKSTKLSVNRRGYQLTDQQINYIKKLFKVA